MPQNIFISERITAGIAWTPGAAPALTMNGCLRLGTAGKLTSLRPGAVGKDGFRKLLQRTVAPHLDNVPGVDETSPDYRLWYVAELPDGEYILNVGGRTSRHQDLICAIRVRRGRLDMLYGTAQEAKRFVEYPPERRDRPV